MKNTKICLLSILATTVFSLAACGGSSSKLEDDEKPEGVITLKYWNGFTGEDGNAMKQIVNNFNKANEGEIKVEVDTVTWDSLFLKLIQNKGREKYSPHIVAMGANRLSSIQSKGILSPLSDFESYLNLDKDDYISAAWNVGDFEGTRYSIPLDMHPTAMFYNKDLISKDEIPTTWDEFEQVIKAKTNTSTGVYGYAIPSMYSITKDIYISMLMQNGGDILDESGNPTFNTAKGAELLERMRKWKYQDKVSPSEVGAAGDLTLFNSGKSVFYFDGPWEINTLKETSSIDFGVAPMPGSTGTGTSYSGSHQFTLVDCTTKNKYIREACYKFIEYVSSNPLEWAKGGQVTAYKPVHDTEEYKALSELQAFTVEAETAKLGNIQYEYYYEAYNYLGTAVANALSEEGTSAKSELDAKANLFKRFVKEQEEDK